MAILTTRALGKRYGTNVGVEDVAVLLAIGGIAWIAGCVCTA